MTDNALDYAIVVAINYYPAFEELEGAEADAEEFIDWLRSIARVPDQQITAVLGGAYDRATNYVDGRPSVSDVDRAFRRLLTSLTANGSRGRRLYIYLTGHGFAPDWDSTALLTAEASENQPGFHLPGREAAKAVLESGLFDEVVLIMDCCRDEIANQPLRHLTWRPPVNATPSPRISFCFASRFGMSAAECYFSDVGRTQAIFSRALFTGLRGGACDINGRVTTSTLEDFVEFYLPTIGGAFGDDGPRFEYEKKRDVEYVDYGVPPLVHVELEVGSWPPVRVVDHRLREIEGTQANGVWRGALVPGFYRVEQTDGHQHDSVFEVVFEQEANVVQLSVFN